ncbi:MAG: trigger factor [Caldisericia bacterium]|nr:trigger factor [Caldisericia bacterium]
MKLSNYEIKDNIATANVDFTKEEMNAFFKSLYKEYAPLISVQGFRKGKAPIHLIKNSINPVRFKEDMITKIGEKGIIFLLNEKDEEYIDYPRIDYKEDPVEDNSYTLILKADLYPTVEIPDLKNSKITAETPPSEKEIFDKKIVEFLDVHSTWEILEDNPSVGDYAVVEYKQVADAKETDEKQIEGQTSLIELGKNTLFPNGDNEIMKLKPGEEVVIPYKTAAKEISFSVKVVSFKKKIMPELTEELLKKANVEKDLAKFNNDFEKEAKADSEQILKERHINSVVEYLYKNTSIDNVPEKLLDNYTNMEVEEYKNNIEKMKLTMDEFLTRSNMKFEAFKKQLEPAAEKRMKIDLIIRQMYKDIPEVKINDDELKSKIKEFLGMYKVDEQKKMDMQEVNQYIKDRMIRENVIKYMETSVPVTFSKKS